MYDIYNDIVDQKEIGMNVGQILSITVTVLLVVIGLYFAQRGVRKGIVKAAMTTGNIVISALLACFFTFFALRV